MRNRISDSSSAAGSSAFEGSESGPDLMAVIAEIEQRVGLLQTLDAPDAEDLERERDEGLAELATRQGSLDAKEREQASLRDSIVRQQAEIDRLQADLREREKAVRSRESDIDGQASQAEEMRASLAAAERALREQQTASAQLAKAQEREQKRLAEHKKFLAEREKEIEAQAEQQRKLRRELTEVATKLAVAEKQNAADAARSETEREAAAARIKELESKCASFEESCKLLKSKREVRVGLAAPALDDGLAMPQAPVTVGVAATSTLTSVPGLIVLMSTVATLAVSAWLWLYAGNQAGSLWVAGAAYLVPLLGCASIRRRGLDMSLMLVAIFAGFLGAWFEPWLGVMSSALELWQLPLEVVPAEIGPQLPIAMAAFTSMLALSIATGLATDSFEILFRGIFVSVATASLLLLPGSGVEIVVASVAVWVLLHTMMLVKWALPETPKVFERGLLAGVGRPVI